MSKIISKSVSHKIKFKIGALKESFNVVLPFIKTDSKYLYVTIDKNNKIYVYSNSPHYEEDFGEWTNKCFSDKDNWKSFAYAKLAKYEGDLKFDYEKIYIIDNPFLRNHYDDVTVQQITLRTI